MGGCGARSLAGLFFQGTGPIQGCRQVAFVRESLLFFGREFVVGVGRDSHWRCRASEAVSDAAVVLGSADENPNRFVVMVTAEHVVNEGDIEIQFAGVFRLELAGLQLDDHIAG